FSPDLSRKLAGAFRGGGGKVDFHVLAPSGSEGHWLAETEAGVRIAGAALDRALKASGAGADRKRPAR
ncbi:MAG: peptidase, partial [Bradyrhizobium sp.]